MLSGEAIYKHIYPSKKGQLKRAKGDRKRLKKPSIIEVVIGLSQIHLVVVTTVLRYFSIFSALYLHVVFSSLDESVHVFRPLSTWWLTTCRDLPVLSRQKQLTLPRSLNAAQKDDKLLR